MNRSHLPAAALVASFALALLALIAPMHAAVIPIPDATGQTGTYSVDNPVTAIGGEDSVYIVGTMTFASAPDTSGAWDVVYAGAYQWGHEWGTARITYFVPGPYVSLVDPVAQGESHLVVLKINQTTGAYSVFVNPNLGLTEAENTSFFDRTGGSTANITNVRFAGGNAGTNTGVIDYNGFAIYTGDDTPFGAINMARIISLKGAGANGVIDHNAKTIALTVPFGTDLATLAPTFTLSSGTCNQTSGAVPSPDFATQNPVDYVVTDTDTDPDTVNTYAVTVTVEPNKPKVLFVSDRNPLPNNDPRVLLTNAGYAVTDFNGTTYGWDLALNNGVDYANSFDLIVHSRNINEVFASLRYQGAIWNALTTPRINLDMYCVGGEYDADSWSWGTPVNSGNPAVTNPGDTYTVTVPADPILVGITLTGGQTPALLSAQGRYWDLGVGASAKPGVTVIAHQTGNPQNVAIAYAAPDALQPGGAAQYFMVGGPSGDSEENIFTADGETVFLNAVEVLLNSAAARITSFEGAGATGATGVINQGAKTIALEVPFGTDLATLAPTFTLSSGTCNQTSGVVPSPNFASQNTVDYVVTDTDTDPDTVNTYAVTVTVAPETATLVIDLGTSPAGTAIEGGAFIGSGPTNLPLPALPAGSILKSIAVDAVLEATDNDNYASDLSLLLDPTPGIPGGDFSVEITNGTAPLGGAALDLNWPTSADAGVGTDLIDTKTDADWAAAGPIDLATTGLFLGNAFGTAPAGGTWSGTITLTYVVGSGGSAYSTWAGGESFAGDKNGDGVPNGLAFLLGAADPDANALGLLPTPTEDGSGGLVMTFTMLDSASRGTAALSVEHTGDLGITDAWAAILVPDTTQVVGGVDFQVSGSGTLDVIATIPESGNAIAGKLFGRLQGTE